MFLRYDNDGGDLMKAIDITLSNSEQINSLVNLTNSYPFTILLRQGRYLVDAKSVLGVCSLQRATPIHMEIYSDNCESLIDALRPMLV